MLKHLLPLAIALLPAAATAEPAPSEYSRSGPYLGVEGAFGVDIRYEEAFDDANTDLAGSGTNVVGRVDTALGCNARIGYRLHPRIAVEAEVEWHGGFDVKVDNDRKVVRSDTLFASGNVKGYPLTSQRIQPFLLVGAGYYRTTAAESAVPTEIVDGEVIDTAVVRSVSGHDVALRTGIGFEGYITEQVAFTLDVQYVLPLGDLDDLDYISIGLGLQYRF